MDENSGMQTCTKLAAPLESTKVGATQAAQTLGPVNEKRSQMLLRKNSCKVELGRSKIMLRLVLSLASQKIIPRNKV